MHTCYLCHSKNTALAFSKLSHEIWFCHNCRLYFLNFDYDYDKFIKSYYQKGFFTGNPKLRAYANYEGDKYIISLNMRNCLKRLQRYLSNNYGEAKGAASVFSARSLSSPERSRGVQEPVSTEKMLASQFASQKHPTLLDCGCAMGFFMEEAEKLGFDAYGVDISKYAAEKAKKLFDQRVKLGPVEQVDSLFNSKTKFDVITMFDLIEHLKNPRLVLQKLRGLLKENGIIVIETGDVSSKWADFLGSVIFRGDVHFFGRPIFNQDTGGNIVIRKNQIRVEVKFDKEYEKIPAIIANLVYEEGSGFDESKMLDPDYTFIISKRSTKGFFIVLNKQASEDMTFSWVALAVAKYDRVENSEPIPSQKPTVTIIPTPIPKTSVIPSLEPEKNATPTPQITNGP